MGAPKPTLGYRTRTEAVLALKQQGLSHKAIAAKVGIPEKNVASLAMAGRTRGVRPSEKNGRTIVFPLDTLNRLRSHADVRGITVNELCRRLIDTAVDEKMVDNILDDMGA